MQIDGHHAATYVAARIAGFAFKDAEKIAYAAWSLAFFFVTAAFLSGCASTVSGEPKAHISDETAPIQALLQKHVCSAAGSGPRTAFFMTISGGGSRSALFGARVLSELKRVGGDDLAAHIDAISSVSGGAMAAALYGISKDAGPGDAWRPVWDDNLIRDRLAANLKVSMAEQLANPVFLGGYVFGHKTRTDALFAALDSKVLGMLGNRALAMGDMSPERPQVIINSTVATQDDSAAFRPRPFGSLFTFSPIDLGSIGVDYASMPISRAVAASAAFPGLLSPVILNRFQLGSTEKELGDPKYIHLIDGGNVDNLGLLAVKRSLIEDSHRVLTDCDQIIVLTVDAFGSQGEHRDDTPSMRSALGLVIDGNTLFSAFDSLLAANRTRLLAEFKSRMFTPPADSEQCRKDGLPYSDCIGGVRVNWDEVNTLLKQKLFFVHLSFDSKEVAAPPLGIHCRGAYEKGKRSDCDYPPVDSFTHGQEVRALRSRLKRIPTTFGLSREELADIAAFTQLLFTPQNECLLHMRDMLLRGARHTAGFYKEAGNSCDETSSLTEEQMSRRRGRSEISGDWISTNGGSLEKRKVEEQPSRKVFTTSEEREAFWNQVLMYYGWGASESKR